MESISGNGATFKDFGRVSLAEPHRLLLEASDALAWQQTGASFVMGLGSCIAGTRIWGCNEERLRTNLPHFESSIRLLGATSVFVLIDLGEEEKKRCIGQSLQSLRSVFPDGKIGGVRFLPIGYHGGTDNIMPRWANQCNALLAMATAIPSVRRLIMLSLETSVTSADCRVRPGQEEMVVTCRVNDVRKYPDEIFRQFEKNPEGVLQATMGVLTSYVQRIAKGEASVLPDYYLPMVMMLNRNTCGIFGISALHRTRGWDPLCDERGGMEDVKRWLCSLILMEKKEPGWCKRNLLSSLIKWLFYKDVRGGVSLLPNDEKWGREKRAATAVLEDIAACDFCVPSDRSIYTIG